MIDDIINRNESDDLLDETSFLIKDEIKNIKNQENIEYIIEKYFGKN